VVHFPILPFPPASISPQQSSSTTLRSLNVRCAIVHGSRGRYARFTVIFVQRGGFSAMKNVFGNDITE
jgi:hypothetical protein